MVRGRGPGTRKNISALQPLLAWEILIFLFFLAGTAGLSDILSHLSLSFLHSYRLFWKLPPLIALNHLKFLCLYMHASILIPRNLLPRPPVLSVKDLTASFQGNYLKKHLNKLQPWPILSRTLDAVKLWACQLSRDASLFYHKAASQFTFFCTAWW